MARHANNPDEFQAAQYALEDLMKVQPVDNTTLFEHFQAAETAGQAVTGRGDRAIGYVANFLLRDLVAMTDAEVVPPLDEAQQKFVAEKAGFYARLLDKSQESKPGKAAKPTPTRAIRTSSRKP